MKPLTRADIADLASYAARRAEHRREARAIKRHRRVDVGPFVSFYFENRATMWHQIHEMLHIEQGGEDQIADELAAYNPLIPSGRELCCTMMIEIDDPERRDAALRRLGWIDEKVALKIGADSVAAAPLQDACRNTQDGKTSSVHFLRFRLDRRLAAAFQDASVPVFLEIGHSHYGHAARIAGQQRQALAADLD